MRSAASIVCSLHLVATVPGLLALGLLVGCDRPSQSQSFDVASAAAQMSADVTAQTVGAGADWQAHGAADDESGYSRLASINTGNVDRLGLAWSLDLPGEASLEATPLAVDGVLYFTGTHSAVYAVDGRTGKLLWKHDPEVWRYGAAKMRLSFSVNRGAAYADGRVFAGTFDGRLLALDARSGKLLWSVVTTAPEGNQYITGAPRVMKNKVIIGNGGADYGARGYVTAYDVDTGRQIWRFYTVPGSPEQNKGDPAMERAAKTWSGEYWKTGTGGTVWNGITFDPQLNRVYIGTGNSGPYDPVVRSPGDGDNLYLVSIVALDADSGQYLWHYQVNPREAWDYKATANIIAATLRIDGKPRDVLMQAPTNGFFYVLERKTGKLLSAEKIGKVTWAERIDLSTGRPVETDNIRYEKGVLSIWPSPLGAHNWQAMSYSPSTGLVYIPSMRMGATYTRFTPEGKPLAYSPHITLETEGPEDGTGSLLAWDPARQKPVWKIPLDSFWNGGTLATAGGLVLQGTGSGFFSAYDASSGKKLWSFNARHGIIAAPISYAIDGKQYIAVLAGYGGTASSGSAYMNTGWKYGAQPRRLQVFALDANAELPPTAAPDLNAHVVDDPTIRIDEADVAPGQALFVANCALCHGYNVISGGGTAPDLRESHVVLHLEALKGVLKEGALLPRGMPRFDNLSDRQITQIHAYIRARSRASLGTRQPFGDSKAASRRS